MYRLLNLRKTTNISYKLLSHRKTFEENGLRNRYFSSLDPCPCLCNQNNAVGQKKMLGKWCKLLKFLYFLHEKLI